MITDKVLKIILVGSLKGRMVSRRGGTGPRGEIARYGKQTRTPRRRAIRRRKGGKGGVGAY